MIFTYLRPKFIAAVITLLTLQTLCITGYADSRESKSCTLLSKLKLIDENAVPVDHPITRISKDIPAIDLSEEVKIFANTGKEIHDNLLAYVKKDALRKPSKASPGKSFLTRKKAEYLNTFIRDHPIVGLKQTREKYDPEGCLGFCFGRASVAHMEALLLNIEPSSIFKIWVAGPMKSDAKFNEHFEVNWFTHVAAMFKSAEGEWLVIDPFYEKVHTAEEWINRHQEFAENNWQLLFHVSDPRRFEVDSQRMYSPTAFFHEPAIEFKQINEFHLDYFSDVFDRQDLSNFAIDQ